MRQRMVLMQFQYATSYPRRFLGAQSRCCPLPCAVLCLDLDQRREEPRLQYM
jgi:hypothetical protein